MVKRRSLPTANRYFEQNFLKINGINNNDIIQQRLDDLSNLKKELELYEKILYKSLNINGFEEFKNLWEVGKRKNENKKSGFSKNLLDLCDLLTGQNLRFITGDTDYQPRLKDKESDEHLTSKIFFLLGDAIDDKELLRKIEEIPLLSIGDNAENIYRRIDAKIKYGVNNTTDAVNKYIENLKSKQPEKVKTENKKGEIRIILENKYRVTDLFKKDNLLSKIVFNECYKIFLQKSKTINPEQIFKLIGLNYKDYEAEIEKYFLCGEKPNKKIPLKKIENYCYLNQVILIKEEKLISNTILFDKLKNSKIQKTIENIISSYNKFYEKIQEEYDYKLMEKFYLTIDNFTPEKENILEYLYSYQFKALKKYAQKKISKDFLEKYIEGKDGGKKVIEEINDKEIDPTNFRKEIEKIECEPEFQVFLEKYFKTRTNKNLVDKEIKFLEEVVQSFFAEGDFQKFTSVKNNSSGIQGIFGEFQAFLRVKLLYGQNNTTQPLIINTGAKTGADTTKNEVDINTKGEQLSYDTLILIPREQKSSEEISNKAINTIQGKKYIGIGIQSKNPYDIKEHKVYAKKIDLINKDLFKRYIFIKDKEEQECFLRSNLIYNGIKEEYKNDLLHFIQSFLNNFVRIFYESSQKEDGKYSYKGINVFFEVGGKILQTQVIIDQIIELVNKNQQETSLSFEYKNPIEENFGKFINKKKSIKNFENELKRITISSGYTITQEGRTLENLLAYLK